MLPPRNVMVSAFSSARGAFRFNKSSTLVHARMSSDEGVVSSMLSEMASSLTMTIGAMWVPPKASKLVRWGKDRSPNVFEAVKDHDPLSDVPGEDGIVGIVGEKVEFGFGGGRLIVPCRQVCRWGLVSTEVRFAGREVGFPGWC